MTGTFKKEHITHAKRITIRQHFVFIAKTIEREEKPRVLLLAGPEPNEEVEQVRFRWPSAKITLCDKDSECVEKANEISHIQRVHHGDVNELFRGRPSLSRVFDIVHLDFTATLHEAMRETVDAARNFISPDGFLIVTFSIGRESRSEHRTPGRTSEEAPVDTYLRFLAPIDSVLSASTARVLEESKCATSVMGRIVHLTMINDCLMLRSAIRYSGKNEKGNATMPMCSLLFSIEEAVHAWPHDLEAASDVRWSKIDDDAVLSASLGKELHEVGAKKRSDRSKRANQTIKSNRLLEKILERRDEEMAEVKREIASLKALLAPVQVVQPKVIEASFDEKIKPYNDAGAREQASLGALWRKRGLNVPEDLFDEVVETPKHIVEVPTDSDDPVDVPDEVLKEWGLERVQRTHRFNLMLSKLEYGMLSDLAEIRGVSASDILRSSLRIAHAEELDKRRQAFAKSVANVAKRTGSIENVISRSSPYGRSFFRGRIRLSDGSQIRCEIPESQRYVEALAREHIQAVQEAEDRLHTLQKAKDEKRELRMLERKQRAEFNAKHDAHIKALGDRDETVEEVLALLGRRLK